MTAGKGQPRARLTKADERAIARLLRADDDAKVMTLALAINHYEVVASYAKARLGKLDPIGPMHSYWQGGYRAAMQTVLGVIAEMIGASYSARDILRAVGEVACSASDLAFIEETAESWCGGES